MDPEPQSSVPPEQESPHEPLPLGVLVVCVVASVGALALAVVWGGGRLIPEKSYDSSTPEAVLASAGEMIRDRSADRLVDLIESVPPEERGTEQDLRMRDLLSRLGGVLREADALHRAVAAEMPEQIDELRDELERARAEGRPTSLLASLMPNRSRGIQSGRDEARERAFAQLLADPFGQLDAALSEQIDRVGTTQLAPELVAITWDGRGLFPPFGLTMREHEDGWRVVPPTSLPMVRRFMPDTEEEYQIWGSLLLTAETLLIDLRKDVESGRIVTIDELSRRAIEDAVIPMGMVFVALGNAMEED